MTGDWLFAVDRWPIPLTQAYSMAHGVTIELGRRNDPDFPRECVEVWQSVEESETLASFDSREEAVRMTVYTRRAKLEDGTL